MLFSSWRFILVFLPITFLVYFWLNHRRLVSAGKVWLVLASLYFYAHWEIKYLPLLLGSILFNYLIGSYLSANQEDGLIKPSHLKLNRKAILIVGILANLFLLSYFKYMDFFVSNANDVLGTSFPKFYIILPLAISFFTFTQIVYLVDSFRRETGKYNLLNYSLFVTFFPHLIAGPIVHHGQIMPQFESRWTLVPRYTNILKGLFIFSIGLFKKVVIADSFAIWVAEGFDGGQTLSFFAAWACSLSYTFQLYFDFSGYCDMAVGISLLFNIWLPINFNSPYKALDIQDFWRRWHITLSNFLRDYLYIPLGGSRNGELHTYINLLITFILGGLWHGATWMFVVWGALHGIAIVAHRFWRTHGWPLPRWISWALTFFFVNFAWIFFRAKSHEDAIRVLSGMLDYRSALQSSVYGTPTIDLAWGGWMSDIFLHIFPASMVGELPCYLALTLGFILIFQKNSMELLSRPINNGKLIFMTILFSIAMYFKLATTSSVFLYFNF
jgi:alginate O-acetyltransferase complex protein AlgI